MKKVFWNKNKYFNYFVESLMNADGLIFSSKKSTIKCSSELEKDSSFLRQKIDFRRNVT